jgi:hypothetical protein
VNLKPDANDAAETGGTRVINHNTILQGCPPAFHCLSAIPNVPELSTSERSIRRRLLSFDSVVTKLKAMSKFARPLFAVPVLFGTVKNRRATNEVSATASSLSTTVLPNLKLFSKVIHPLLNVPVLFGTFKNCRDTYEASGDASSSTKLYSKLCSKPVCLLSTVPALFGIFKNCRAIHEECNSASTFTKDTSKTRG